MFTSLGFLLVSVLVHVFVIQTGNYVLFLDWESRQAEGVPVSAWRRINVANEWASILTVRSYNIVFTIIVIIFVLNGFDVVKLSIPIPTPELIDAGPPHFILRIACDTMLWLIVMGGQYLWYHMVYWRLLGNPFFNFLDLCSCSNISVLAATSASHAYYLHGRSVQSHCDVDMKKLSRGLADEEEGLVGLRGLLPGQKEQVFECFFSREFAQQMSQFKERLQLQVKSWSGRLNVHDIPQDFLANYEELNKYLKSFFDKSAPENRYVVQEAEFLAKYFGSALQTSDSVLNPVRDSHFKRTMLAGAEWYMMLMYAVLFTVIDFRTNSPGLAGFIVYAIDFLLVWLFKRLARSRLAMAALLDSRFLLA
jgi:meckelin